MLLCALALGGVSLLTHPLYLDPDPPELRAARNVLVLYDAGEQAHRHGRPGAGRSAQDALRIATEALEALRAGEDFAAVAARCSDDPNAHDGALLGSFARGMLAPALDGFLFSAELGQRSEPLAVEGGWQVLERVESLAAVRQILLSGPQARERLARIRAALADGADFARLAEAYSDDESSRARGGAFAIYERGRRDRLLKRAAFAARVGEVVGPIESPLGLHLLQRVPVDSLEPSLRESNWARARAILLRHELSEGAAASSERTPEAALALGNALHARILAGEDMAALARENDDDLGGRERGGDLGWIYRFGPEVAPALDGLFLLAPGELSDVLATPLGILFYRREG